MENRKNLSQKPYLTGGRLGGRIILDSSVVKYKKGIFEQTQGYIKIIYNGTIISGKDSIIYDIKTKKNREIKKGEILGDQTIEYLYDVKKDEMYSVMNNSKTFILKGPIDLKTTWKSKITKRTISDTESKATEAKLCCKYKEVFFDKNYQRNCFKVECNNREYKDASTYCYGLGQVNQSINGVVIKKYLK